MPTSFDERIRAHLSFLHVFAVAMVLGVFFYAGMAWILLEGPASFEPLAAGIPDLAPPLVAAGAVLLLLVAPVVHRRLVQSGGPASTPDGFEPVLESHRLATILSWVLREGAAMIGLMLALITGQAAWCYGLAAAAVVGMFIAWPRREELDEIFGPSVAPPSTERVS